MFTASLDWAARVVLAHFVGPCSGERLHFLGNRGGFSGARLWRLDGDGGPFCLRAWLPGAATPDRLMRIHRLMSAARQAGLAFVPAVLPTMTGSTWVEHAGRLWDLTTWLPGRADFHERPTRARLEAACAALARLHLVWSHRETRTEPCPAVQRRLACYREWVRLRQSGWQSNVDPTDSAPVDDWAGRAWSALDRWAERIPHCLKGWVDRELPVQPCLCDLWHDHVLYEGDTVTGLVDYGSVKRDHVAVDLARLLGSLIGDDVEMRGAGLEAYGRRRPLTAEEIALIAALDFTGTLLGAANWLQWLYRDKRHFEDRDAVAARLAALVQRIEQWESAGLPGQV
jgi:Ser/Thr protein kinase RdoA (MazF antagonist)